MRITTKIDFTTDAVTCWPSDSALPPTFKPSTAATIPMISAMNGALIMPGEDRSTASIASLQARR